MAEFGRPNQYTGLPNGLDTSLGALHSKSDVDRFYIPGKEAGGGLTSIEDCVE